MARASKEVKLVGATNKVSRCPQCGRKTSSWDISFNFGCLFTAIGLAVIIWAASGFPKFWE